MVATPFRFQASQQRFGKSAESDTEVDTEAVHPGVSCFHLLRLQTARGTTRGQSVYWLGDYAIRVNRR